MPTQKITEHTHSWKYRHYESKGKKNLLVCRYCPGCQVEQWGSIGEGGWSKGHRMSAVKLRASQRV